MMTLDDLRSAGDGVTLLDVSGHTPKAEIRGAIRYRPHDLLAGERLVLPIAHDRPVVLYDDAKGQHAFEVAQRLRDSGLDVRVLDGGIDAWREAGGATQEPSLEQIVPPTQIKT